MRFSSVACVVVMVAGFVPLVEAQTWSDEFNGTGAVDSAKWVYDVGAGGWGNNELQYYQSGAANAVQQDGFLRITARRQSVGGAAYTSARLKTQGRMNVGQYGRIEARLRGPMGQGLWPAFWSLGSNFPGVAWPGCGEIDIMEHINTGGNTFGTIHWDMSGYQFYTGAQPAVNFAAWNTYAIEWNSSYIRWVVNGANVGEANILNNINGTEEFHRPFFLILNLAVGGNWPGPPNASTVFPAFLDVDYVRYWAAGTNPNPTPTPTPPPNGNEIIVDNGTAAFSTGGAWTASTSTPGFIGSNYLHDGSAAVDTGKWAKWKPTFPSAGSYTVYARWTSASNRPANVRYRVSSQGVVTDVFRNQQASGGTWVSLGTYTFGAGNSESNRVTLDAGSSAGNVIADAVRFVRN